MEAPLDNFGNLVDNFDNGVDLSFDAADSLYSCSNTSSYADKIFDDIDPSQGSLSSASDLSPPSTPGSTHSTPQRPKVVNDEVSESPTQQGHGLQTPNSTRNSNYIKNESFQPVEYEPQAQQPEESRIDFPPNFFNTYAPLDQVDDNTDYGLRHPALSQNVPPPFHTTALPMFSIIPGSVYGSFWGTSFDEPVESYGPELVSMLHSDHAKRRPHVDETRNKNMGVGRRVKQRDGPRFSGVIKCGTHKCLEKECINRKAFKRSEHLKRHWER